MASFLLHTRLSPDITCLLLRVYMSIPVHTSLRMYMYPYIHLYPSITTYVHVYLRSDSESGSCVLLCDGGDGGCNGLGSDQSKRGRERMRQ